MSVKVEKIGDSQVEMEITVAVDTMEEQVVRTARKLAGSLNIPGFRRGKAPRRIVEAHVGKKIVLSEAAEEIMEQEYLKALDESEIEPVSMPEEPEIVMLEPGQDFVFKVKVYIEPEIKLGAYKALGLEAAPYEVKEEDVEAELLRMQHIHAKLVNLSEGEVLAGDTTQVSTECFIDGELYEDESIANLEVIAGAAGPQPNVAGEIVGAAIGSEIELKHVYPESFFDEVIAGKEALMRVKIHSVKRTEELPLDDEFAKDVSEFDTLDEYRASLREIFKANGEAEAAQKLSDDIIKKAIENAEIEEIPESLIEMRLEEIVEGMGMRMQQSGFSLQEYYKFTGLTEETFRAQNRENAVNAIKTSLFLEAVAQEEGIFAEVEDLDKEYERIARESGQDKEDLRQVFERRGGHNELATSIVAEKAHRLVLRENGVNLDDQEPVAEGDIIDVTEEKEAQELAQEAQELVQEAQEAQDDPEAILTPLPNEPEDSEADTTGGE